MKQSEMLEAQTGEQDKTELNTTLIEREPLAGTPFTRICKDDKYFLAIKNYQVTENFNTAEELHEYMEHSMWDLVSRTTVVLIGICKEIENSEK